MSPKFKVQGSEFKARTWPVWDSASAADFPGATRHHRLRTKSYKLLASDSRLLTPDSQRQTSNLQPSTS